MTALHAVVQLAATPDNGIFDLVNTKADQAKATLITVAGAVAVAYTIYRAVMARMAIGAVVVAALAAAVFLWVITNIGVLQDKVANEVNGLGAVQSQYAPDPPGQGSARPPS